MEYPSLIGDLRTERAKHGATMTNDQCVDAINAVLWKNRGLGYSLAGDRGGNFGKRFDGKKCEVDGIVLPDGTWVDCWGDAGGKSTPAWQVKKVGSVASDGHVVGPFTGERVAPINPGGVVDPSWPPTPPTPPTPPLPPPSTDFEKRLSALEAKVRALESKPTPVPGTGITEDQVVEVVLRRVRTESRQIALTHDHGLVEKK